MKKVIAFISSLMMLSMSVSGFIPANAETSETIIYAEKWDESDNTVNSACNSPCYYSEMLHQAMQENPSAKFAVKLDYHLRDEFTDAFMNRHTIGNYTYDAFVNLHYESAAFLKAQSDPEFQELLLGSSYDADHILTEDETAQLIDAYIDKCREIQNELNAYAEITCAAFLPDELEYLEENQIQITCTDPYVCAIADGEALANFPTSENFWYTAYLATEKQTIGQETFPSDEASTEPEETVATFDLGEIILWGDVTLDDQVNIMDVKPFTEKQILQMLS